MSEEESVLDKRQEWDFIVAGINAVVICTILIYAGKYVIKKLTSNMKTGLEDVGEKLTNKMAEQNEHS